VSALSFFDQLYELALQATDGSRASLYVRAANRVIRVVFSSETLAGQLSPAISHLLIEEQSAPDLTIYTWDSGKSALPLPDAIWKKDDVQPTGRIDGLDSKRVRAAFLPRTDGFTMLDLGRNIGLHHVPDATSVSVHQRSYPFRTLISWFGMQHQMTFVHGAVVGRERGGVLLGGASGSGKSTSALTCLQSELLYVSDDHVLLEELEGVVYAHGLYNSAKLHYDQLLQFPQLREQEVSDASADDKALFFVKDFAPERLVRGLPLSAIFVPIITGEQDTQIVQGTQAQAMMSLAPSSLFLIPLDQAQAFSSIAAYVRKLPIYEIQLGTELAQIPDRISAFLEGILA